MKVTELKVGGVDATGDRVLCLYGFNPPFYAVYRTPRRVVVHYADDDRIAAVQRKAITPLNPLRGQINGLIDGWRDELAGSVLEKRAQAFDRRVGDALTVGFEDDIDGAKILLSDIRQDLLDGRIANARLEYLIFALATGLAWLFFIWAGTLRLSSSAPGMDEWRAAASGTVGAFFSIALAIRGRTVLPDLQRVANMMDASLRMVIGVIAAAVLMAIVATGTIRLQLGEMALTGPPDSHWAYVLIVGFLAGFSERFVPDLLSKAAATSPAPAPAPKGGGQGGGKGGGKGCDDQTGAGGSQKGAATPPEAPPPPPEGAAAREAREAEAPAAEDDTADDRGKTD